MNIELPDSRSLTLTGDSDSSKAYRFFRDVQDDVNTINRNTSFDKKLVIKVTVKLEDS